MSCASVVPGRENMRKIDLIQVLKSVVKKCWIPILLAVLGAGCTSVAVKMQQDQLTITWTLNNRYVISLDGRQNYDSYLYEEKMAAVVNDLLGQDKELREMSSTFSAYSAKVSHRRIELSIQGENEEKLMQTEHLFFEKAQTYLSEEFVQAATITLESTAITEDVPIDKALSPKVILLGALIGLCIGLSIVLIIEYVKSPIEAIEEKEGGGQ